MPKAKHFKWLPNAITSVRLAAAVPVAVFIATGAWELALWIYFVALASDFFDGLTARKLRVSSKFGENLDGLADTLLAAAALITLLFVGQLPLLPFLALVIGAILLRYIRSNPERMKGLYSVVPMFEVGTLFITIVYVVWTLATLAYGWQGWYVPATLAALVVLATLKRGRLRVWCAAILPAKWRLPPQGS